MSIYAKADSTHVPSMLLDAERGQPIEVEVISGEVVRMAKERQVDMPVSIATTDNVPRRSTWFFLTSVIQRVEILYSLLLVGQNQVLRKIETGERYKGASLGRRIVCNTFQSAYFSLSPCPPRELYLPSRTFQTRGIPRCNWLFNNPMSPLRSQL